MTCSGFEGDIDILAVRADNDDLVAISVYEKGAKTMKGTTKAIHVNIWPHSTGWATGDRGWMGTRPPLNPLRLRSNSV